MRTRFYAQFTVLLALGIMCLLVAPTLGATSVPIRKMLTGELSMIEATVLWEMRVPRVLFAFCAGASLAIGGLVFQGIFRNPLASPYTLGVSSGAAFGAILSVKFGIDALGGLGAGVASMLGAVLTIAMILTLSKVLHDRSSVTMLLCGVVVNFFFGSVIILMQYLSNFVEVYRITRWLMGSVETVGYSSVVLLSIVSVIGLIGAFRYARELNLLTTGEELAETRGVDTERCVLILFILVSVIVGAVVSVCGPIGFVGIMVPHMARSLFGNDFRRLVPTSFFIGGTFLVVCDTAARVIIAPSEIPVGIITALLGGPFFLWILLRERVRGRN